MTNPKDLQQIPVVRNEATPKHAWLVLFDYARRCGVSVDIHSTEAAYHAEEMLRIWAASENLPLREEEVRPTYGSTYVNVKVPFVAHGYTSLCGVTIYRTRELVRVEPEPDEAPEYPNEEDVGHDDERGAYADGVPPDSNEVLGLSQDINRDGWR